VQIAYSTYAMQSVDSFEAVDGVKRIGYEGLEINCGDDWLTAPARFGSDDRKRLSEAYQAAGFPPPVVMNLIHLCGHTEDVKDKTDRLEATCQFARDMCWLDQPSVVTTTLGKQASGWDESKASIVEHLPVYANIAADHNVVLAIEAHVGQEMDTPEKARWLVDAMDHPNLRLNFDFSHFLLLDIDLQHALDLNASCSVHTHIKDGSMVDGQVRFALPGDDRLDLVDYLRRLGASELDVPVTVEVSGQIWKLEDYDPWAVAKHCFENLNAARNEVR
jgi:sugar phosphate isomerase/epimerase